MKNTEYLYTDSPIFITDKAKEAILSSIPEDYIISSDCMGNIICRKPSKNQNAKLFSVIVGADIPGIVLTHKCENGMSAGLLSGLKKDDVTDREFVFTNGKSAKVFSENDSLRCNIDCNEVYIYGSLKNNASIKGSRLYSNYAGYRAGVISVLMALERIERNRFDTEAVFASQDTLMFRGTEAYASGSDSSVVLSVSFYSSDEDSPGVKLVQNKTPLSIELSEKMIEQGFTPYTETKKAGRANTILAYLPECEVCEISVPVRDMGKETESVSLECIEKLSSVIVYFQKTLDN